MKSHHIMADLGKTGAAFFLCGRPQPVTASCQGTSCTNLHTRQDDRLTEPRGLPHPTSGDSGELCPAGSGARPLSFSTLPSGRGAGAARVPRGCRPGQPAASLLHDETSLASQFLASEQPGMPVAWIYVV